MAEFVDVMLQRKSCRCFQENPVEQNLIDQILLAGIQAPTAHNSQAYKMVVLQGEEVKEASEEILQELKQYEKWGIPIGSAKRSARIMRDAPVNVYIFMKKNEFFKKDQVNIFLPEEYLKYIERENDVQDILSIGTVIENMLLMAQELQLGGICISEICYAKDFCEKYFAPWIDLDKYEFASSLAFGYRDDISFGKTGRKKLEDIVAKKVVS